MSALVHPASARPPLIGLLGGTFDPVHFGHLRLGEEMREALELDELRLLPAAQPPHRPLPVADARTRLQLLQLAVDGVPGFCVDARELQRPGPSYTVDSLRLLRADYPAASLVWILGADAFNGFTRWHDWPGILEHAHLAVASRPGSRIEGEAARLLAERGVAADALRERRAGGIVPVEITALDISATRLRALIARGASTRFLLPEAVREQIHQQGLYPRAAPTDGAPRQP